MKFPFSFSFGFLFFMFMIFTNPLQALTCPPLPTDGNPTVVPEPWKAYLYSVDPQYEKGISFVNVQIPPKSVSSFNGVICTYQSPSYGNYSIWQPKIARKAMNSGDYWFSDKKLGDTCSESIEKCPFLILNTAD